MVKDRIEELNLIADPRFSVVLALRIAAYEELNKMYGTGSDEGLALLNKLVEYIAERKHEKSAINQLASVDKYSLKMIVTNKREPDISKCNCGARLIWDPFSDSTKMTTDITYDVQYTDDGEGFVVTVYGLSGLDVGADEDDEDD
ncbi:MAG: hypothetical protein ACI4UM_00040 [Succinivibrio sp.]